MSEAEPISPVLLSLNTCAAKGSVALGRLGAAGNGISSVVEILGHAELSPRMHSAQLVPKIGELLAARHMTIQDVQGIVVVRGPGSFTGIRVGLSAAKGLAEGAGIPIVAVSSLALLAFASGLPRVLAVVEAGRGQYYLGEYLEGSMARESLVDGVEILAATQRPGAGALVCAETCDLPAEGEEHAEVLAWNPVRIPEPDATVALRFAIERFRTAGFEDVETLDANYLRRSGTELFGAPDVGGKRRRRFIAPELRIGFRIRPMTALDLDKVIVIAQDEPMAPQWPRPEYERILSAGENESFQEPALRRFPLVAELDGFPVGFAVTSWCRGEGAAWLETIVIDGNHRRRGFGSELLSFSMVTAQKAGVGAMCLELRTSNSSALALYLRHGFRPIGRRRAYYSAPAEDALLLEASLDASTEPAA